MIEESKSYPKCVIYHRMYEAQLDEASIMQCTDHRSVTGVCTLQDSAVIKPK